MDTEVNRFIFRHEDKLFRTWYPNTLKSIFGKKTMRDVESIHKYVRSIGGPVFAPKNLKEAFIFEMEKTITESLRRWATNPSIEVKQSLRNMMFDLIIKKLVGFEPNSTGSKELRKNIELFFKGVISFPLLVPGTNFYQAMQSGRALLDENFLVDTVAGFIFAGVALTPTTLTAGMKFLTDSPNVVEALSEEHDTILKNRDETQPTITWEEFKTMKFTDQVINEILRLSSNGPGITRQALKDVQYNGYTIPAGWVVMISPMSVHLNPDIFEDPLTFNPWRWQEENANSLMKHFMPFGDGKRHCMGANFTKFQIAMFLHTLVTKYRWKEIKRGETFRIADLAFPQDYHIKLLPRS
ncbi:cytochrome P450 87A3-like [Setaria viridis]|uniref:cytochrome P450 87A3-like n=1 Tax=Setaria viridis TaxID=4556 RepID=UPI003B3A9E75